MHSPAQIIPVELLLLAYRSGIFPMADDREDEDVYWVEPRQRAILPLDRFHLSRSLARTLRSERFRVTCNREFAAVMDACAEPRPGHPKTWISRRIAASYRALHLAGHAHSVEVWEGDPATGSGQAELVGGLYGVAFDRVFCGESMFSRRPDASKVALAWLIAALRRGGFMLHDCQFITPHLASLGAIEVPRATYLKLLADAIAGPEGDGEGVVEGLAGDVSAAFGALLADAAGAASSPGKLIAQSLTHTS